ncbi:MAG: hypothetical protein LUC48_09655 [Clostridiales bacterium]|nr:hypothetical protein [Clostridiales bacterium]
MGGRGAASGNGKHPYGTEFQSLLEYENIKFVKQTSGRNAKDPLETQTKGRVYVTVNARGELNSINFYDDSGRREKSINLSGHGEGKDIHVHLGYYHSENGERPPNPSEIAIVEKIRRIWYNRNNR